MRNLHIYLSALASLKSAFGIRHGASQLRDLEAFPKFEVQFLNHLPVTESEAARCQKEGLRREDDWSGTDTGAGFHRLDGVDEGIPSEGERLELIRMALTHPSSNETQPYLCLMPSAATTAAQNVQAEVEPIHEEIDPVQSWLALSHLDGKCLYAKQGWFTYAYCHNSHLRQFRSAPHAHPHPPGGYTPVEDPTYDAYTLGQARASARNKAQSSLPQAKTTGEDTNVQVKPKASSEEAQTGIDRAGALTQPGVASSISGANRYLTQKWSDGTRCDKTGRPRETEIQFHCSMTSNDQIYLIKEMAICQYILIVHSPHLCSLPGFRPEQVDVEPAGIKCRQVMKDDEYQAWQASEGQGGIPTLRPAGLEAAKTVGSDVPELEAPSLNDLLKKAFESKQALLAGALPKRGDSVDGGQSSGGDKESGQEVMFISIEEDEEGNAEMVLDAEKLMGRVLAGEEGEEEGPVIEVVGEGQHDIANQERELIIKAVRDFLGKKRGHKSKKETDQEDEERVRDEL